MRRTRSRGFRLLGRDAWDGGEVKELTPSRATQMLRIFTETTKGLVPAPETATGAYLKDDGTWDTPAGGGGGDTVTVNGAGVTDADLDDATPAAPAGDLNVKWQTSGSGPANISAYVDVSVLEPLVTLGNLAGTIATAKIADAAVTLAKLADLATQRLIGRNTAGTGVPESVTITQVLDWIGSTHGNLFYRASGGWVALAPASWAGHVLSSGGSGADLSWVPGWTYVVLGSDESNTTTTPVTTALAFTPAASATYRVEVHGFAETSTAGIGVQLGWSVPTGLTRWCGTTRIPGPLANQEYVRGHNATDNAVNAAAGHVGNDLLFVGEMMITTGGSPSGNVAVTLKHETGAVGTVYLRAGSVLRYMRVA